MNKELTSEMLKSFAEKNKMLVQAERLSEYKKTIKITTTEDIIYSGIVEGIEPMFDNEGEETGKNGVVIRLEDNSIVQLMNEEIKLVEIAD